MAYIVPITMGVPKINYGNWGNFYFDKEIPQNMEVLYEILGLNASQIKLEAGTGLLQFGAVNQNIGINEDKGYIHFLDISQNEISNIYFSLNSTTKTATYDIPVGTAYILIQLNSIQCWLQYYGTPPADHIYKDNFNHKFLFVDLLDSSGNVLDEIAFNMKNVVSVPFDGSTTYSVRSLIPELEISYSLVNTLKYTYGVGIYIDEVLGTVGPTDRFYLQLYQNDELLDETFLEGSQIKEGAYMLLEQNESKNAGANVLSLKIQASPAYKYTINCHPIVAYKFPAP